jgi:hypothetical protein
VNENDEQAAAAPLEGAVRIPGDLREVDPIRHRFAFHPPTSDLIASTHNFIRARHLSLAQDFVRDLPDCRERSLALTALEESMMWANAAVARVLNYEAAPAADIDE